MNTQHHHERPPRRAEPDPHRQRSAVSRRPPLSERLIGFVLADWWIDVLLMLFIVISMLFLHH